MAFYEVAEDDKGEFVIVYADDVLDFVTNANETIEFFEIAEWAFHIEKPVRYDLSKTKRMSVDAIAMLLSQLKNDDVTKGLFFKVVANDEIQRKLTQEWRYLQKIAIDSQVSNLIYGKAIKHRGTIVDNYLARDLCLEISRYIYGEFHIIRDLYETLIELMANTQDHAKGSSISNHIKNWWMFVSPEKECVNLIFIDNGIGLFESLPVRQHMNRSNLLTEFIPKADAVSKSIRKKELSQVYSDLVNGRIKSSTGLLERGKGIPLIKKNINKSIISRLVVISNDAHIDMGYDKVAVMDHSFSGTMYIVKISQ